MASCLATPILIVDAEGTLIFYNEAAEQILGQRFDETGDMTAREWSAVFSVENAERNPVALDDWPLVIAYAQQRADSRIVWLRCRDGAWRNLSFSAFPIVGQAGQFLGAMSIFWEV